MSDRPVFVMAATMAVSRADEHVAIVLTVPPEELVTKIKRGSPLHVAGIFSSTEHVESIERALAEARADAQRGGAVAEQTEEAVREERKRHEAMIEAACAEHGVTIADWGIDEDNGGRVKALLGRWHPIEEIEDKGLIDEDEGELSASVVGGVRYGNERVGFYLTPDEREATEEVVPFEEVEPLD